MVLQVSGPISSDDIQEEFNQTVGSPFSLEAYYRNAGIVPGTSGVAGGVAEVQTASFSGATSNTLTVGQDELVSITLDNSFDSGFTENFSATITTNLLAFGRAISIEENAIDEGILIGDTLEWSGATYTIESFSTSGAILITPSLAANIPAGTSLTVTGIRSPVRYVFSLDT